MVVHDTTGGEHVQFREDLARRARPEVDETSERPGDPQGALHDRVGDGPAAYLFEVVDIAFEGRARDGGAQARLGRDLTAVAAQCAVPHRGVDGVTGFREGGRDVGEIEQRS